MTHDNLIKEVQQSGLKMSKEKLLELIKKSTSAEINISQSQNNKKIVAVINVT